MQPGRGIRQGDHLSPYLFIYLVEAFIALIQRAKQDGAIRGVKIAWQAPTITSLCFAGDTLLFYRAATEKAVNLKGVIDNYIEVSD